MRREWPQWEEPGNMPLLHHWMPYTVEHTAVVQHQRLLCTPSGMTGTGEFFHNIERLDPVTAVSENIKIHWKSVHLLAHEDIRRTTVCIPLSSGLCNILEQRCARCLKVAIRKGELGNHLGQQTLLRM